MCSRVCSCGICMQIMHEPCYLNTEQCSCRRSFCKNCLAKWVSEEDRCPHCAKSFTTKPELLACCRQWTDFCDSVLRCCPHGPPSGTCNKFKAGDYYALEAHVTSCIHQKIRCENDECGQMIKRKNMKEHMRLCRLKRCPNAVKSALTPPSCISINIRIIESCSSINISINLCLADVSCDCKGRELWMPIVHLDVKRRRRLTVWCCFLLANFGRNTVRKLCFHLRM
jgi:hypothetical protein